MVVAKIMLAAGFVTKIALATVVQSMDPRNVVYQHNLIPFLACKC